MAEADLSSLVLVLAASSLGALLSRLHRRLVLPTVVVEIVLGIVIGPEVLDIAEVDDFIAALANFGLGLLFFFAGLEVVERRVAPTSLARGTVGWALSLAIGLLVGITLQQAGLDAEWWLLGVALCTTTLGALVSILSDTGLLTDSARLGGARLRRRGRVLADRVHLGLPHRSLRRPRRDAAVARLRSARRARRGRGAPGAPPASRPHLAGHHPYDRPDGGAAVAPPARGARAAHRGSRVRLRARRVRRRSARRADARLPGGEARADAAGGDRVRLPDPDLLRRHRDELRSRQPAQPDGARPRSAVPRAPGRRSRRACPPLAARARNAPDAQPRALQRHGPAPDRRDRRDRHGPWRDRRRRRRVVDRRRDDLGAALSARRDCDRRARAALRWNPPSTSTNGAT